MIAIDTNVVVQFITRDDQAQTLTAAKLIAEQRVFVSSSVVLETAWVLRKPYGFERTSVISTLRSFLGLATVAVRDQAEIDNMLVWADRGLDFADALHLAAAEGCQAFVTFDRDFVRRAAVLDSIPVRAP